MKKEMEATTLRSILIVTVLLTLGIATAGFYYGFGWIKTYSEDVNTVIVTAQQTSGATSSVNGLKDQLEKQQEIISTANSLFALSSTYQTQVIKDIYAYANKTDITVSDIKLDSAAPAGTPATPGSKSAATKSVTVSLTGPVTYSSLLRFLSYIEGNIPKMQVSGLDLSRPTDGSSSTVLLTTVTVDVYVR